MVRTLIFIATTIEADLGGIARSVPALAGAVANAALASHGGTGIKEVILLAPQVKVDTLGSVAGLEKVDVRLCDGFSGVKWELEGLCTPSTVLYHAGVWSSLNHFVAKTGRRYGVSVVVSTRSMLDPWALNFRKWKKRLAWWCYARADLRSAAAIHATAELEAGYIRAALGKRCPPLIVVPNGVELATPPARSRSGLRRLLFLSRIHEKKGILDLITAFGALNPADWELVIAGNDEGGHESACRALAARQPKAARIRFVGPVADADKWALYASADLFVLPSYSENFGIVVAEALACGVPVITTTATPWGEFADSVRKETQQRSDLGLWVVEPGAKNLQTALEMVLVMRPEQLSAAGASGAEWVRERFTWEAIGREFVRQLERLLTNFGNRYIH